MIKYKINVADALERKGFNGYQAKKTGLISQETLKKIKSEDTGITLKTLNNICYILDMPISSIIEFKTEENEQKEINKKFQI